MVRAKDAILTAWRGKWPGQRHRASFPSYSLAKKHADGVAKDLAKGSQVTALNPAQARDALAALERLTDYYRTTGRRASPLAGNSEFVEASAKLQGRNLGEVVEGYQSGVGLKEFRRGRTQLQRPRLAGFNSQTCSVAPHPIEPVRRWWH